MNEYIIEDTQFIGEYTAELIESCYELTKSNEKSKGIVEAFGICTTQGILRNYNEDRVSVILNVMKHSEASGEDNNTSKENTIPNSSYFSLFDGHGGNKCANFLRENLHQYILNDLVQMVYLFRYLNILFK